MPTTGAPSVGVVDAFGNTPARDITYLQEFAVRAEAVGFDSLWVPEHIVFFDNYESRYPYNETGVLALGDQPGIFDPFGVLTAAALATTRLKVGTAILLIGERNPLLTAREAATLDQISAGRLLLGVGAGWSREEYLALGVPWERRGRRCDEYIEVLKALWTTERTSYAGEFCSFPEVRAYPKPAQSPHPPVLVGGNTPAALRRAARLGDGWFGWNLALAEVEESLATLDQLLGDVGRSRHDFVLQVGVQLDRSGLLSGSDDLPGFIQGCGRLGVGRVTLAAPFSRRRFSEQLGAYAAALHLG